MFQKDPTSPPARHGSPCDAPAVGARLRTLRQAAGLTQAGVGARIGTTQFAVARMEAGNQRLSLATLSRAAMALGCAVELSFVGRQAS